MFAVIRPSSKSCPVVRVLDAARFEGGVRRDVGVVFVGLAVAGSIVFHGIVNAFELGRADLADDPAAHETHETAGVGLGWCTILDESSSKSFPSVIAGAGLTPKVNGCQTVHLKIDPSI